MLYMGFVKRSALCYNQVRIFPALGGFHKGDLPCGLYISATFIWEKHSRLRATASWRRAVGRSCWTPSAVSSTMSTKTRGGLYPVQRRLFKQRGAAGGGAAQHQRHHRPAAAGGAGGDFRQSRPADRKQRLPKNPVEPPPLPCAAGCGQGGAVLLQDHHHLPQLGHQGDFGAASSSCPKSGRRTAAPTRF